MLALELEYTKRKVVIKEGLQWNAKNSERKIVLAEE
jgi:hypothetical protein